MNTRRLMKSIDVTTTSLSRAVARVPNRLDAGRRLLVRLASRGLRATKAHPGRALLGAFLTGAVLTAFARRT
jgi:hypothetical protein